MRVEDSPFLAPVAYAAEVPARPVEGELAPAWEAEDGQEQWQEAAEAWPPGPATPSQVPLPVQELVELWDVSAALNERVRDMIVQALDQRSTRPVPVLAIAEAELEPQLEDGDEGEDEDEVGSHLIQPMIDKGEPENAITNAVFSARNPKLVGRTLKAGSKAARQWSAIRADEVRPAALRSLGRWMVEPTLLGVFFSQYEGDPRVPAKANEQFLTRSPLLSMGRSLRDRVLTEWRLGRPPVTLGRLHELAMEISGQAGPAMLLCHSVTKAFARGGTVITWDRVPSNPETYSDGRKVWTPAVIHRDGRITRSYSKRYKRELPSIYYVLFSDRELGTEDPGDWYHFFVAAAITAYSATGDMSPRSTPVRELEGDDDRTIVKGTKGRVQDLTDDLYPMVLTERLLDLERQMANPDLVSEPGYRGWLMANAVSFLEGGFYGESQQDVARESRRHLRGAVFGLEAAGARPGRLWVWLVPAAGSLTQADLVYGFLLQHKTVEGLDASGQKFRITQEGSFEGDRSDRVTVGAGEELAEHVLQLAAADSGAGGGGGSSSSSGAVVEPFPTAVTPILGPEDAFDAKMMKDLRRNMTLNPNAAALVDLTGDPGIPPYFGHRDKEMVYTGSLVKIAAMYAAFVLRSRVQEQINATVSPNTPANLPGFWDKVIKDIETSWRPKLAKAFPGLPEDGFPKLREIFKFQSGKISFSVGFDYWLGDMVRHSLADGASKVIQAIGFPYINGVLRAAGFFDQPQQAGMWVSGDYRRNDWKRDNGAGRRLTPRWAQAQGRTRSNFTSTALSVASFLTVLARRQLVDSESSDAMMKLMDGRTNSFVGEALSADKLLFKIGIGDDGRRHDCAIVERKLPLPSGKVIRYVVVGFGFKREKPPVNLLRLFVELDKLVAARHQ